ncbi:MAG: universal stress protein [Planctomycetota bacterium]
MTNIDQFESAFRAADRAVYRYEPPAIGKLMLVTDLQGEDAQEFAARLESFLSVLGDGPELRVEVVEGERFQTVGDLLSLVETEEPDLVVTFRHLHSIAWKWPYSLGEHVDVLTQVAPCPVMVVPHPGRGGTLEHALKNTDQVMAITDRLTGDNRLVNYAARFTQPGGTLHLSHVEDRGQFERMMELISKIPSINTESAREELLKRLMKEPADYIESCRNGLEACGRPVRVESVVLLGRRLAEYRRLVEAHSIDLLVMNTREEDQLAMNGLAYPLAVELRSIPLLLL